ncbi:radical SAM/SPASM domain-containing protein [Jeongeupia chitinilytica]|uniref:4Fe4S-binding SPASM domain-containing protein n=1 Tax=Jeongeupia chitinilytica TaxID=1041641 RepID=A0ABQ3H3B5_9NEIS|nr:radical SAM/SPASM domain-containing protein [Jeongeupia chitinilytica]GHD64295.1 hypothetical protein GCM10007350_23160 [Jeongeupia chitinilytica]
MKICIKPYIDYAVLPNRDVSVCCSAWHEFGPIGNIATTSLQSVWQSERAATFRESVSDGSFRYCHQNACPHLMNQDGPVMAIEEAPAEIRTLIQAQMYGQAPLPKNLHLAFDETCNLRCPSCRHEIIASDKHEVKDIFAEVRAGLSRDVEYINLGGAGDVFASPVLRDWLYNFDASEFPHLRHVHFHTNLQLFSEKVWERLPQSLRSLKVTFDVSMDAASDATYQLNRPPGNWQRLMKNLDFLSKLRQADHVKDVCCNFVVQKNNYHEVPLFIQLVEGFGFDSAKFTKLDNWGTFEDEDYRRRAIHLPTHPEHQHYQAILKDPALKRPAAYLANLA